MRLALAICWLLIGCAVPAQAEPISTAIGLTAAIGAAGFSTATAGAIGGFIVTTTISTSISYLRGALSKKPQQAAAAAAVGVSGKVQAGGVVPRSFVVGTYPCEPSLTYHNTFGGDGNTPNAYYTQEWVLQDLPASGIAEIWVDGRQVTWNPDATPGPDGIPIPEYATTDESGTHDHMWVRFFDGSQTEADARLVGLFGADPNRPYADNRIGLGCAKAVITTKVNPQLFTGFPSVKIVLDGVRLYDRREDDTAGGEGDQRFADAATHAHSSNPIVIAENIVRGIRYGDAWVYGGQTVTAAQVRAAAAIAAMNECDVPIDLAEGGTEPQFAAGALVRFSDAPVDVIKELLKACNGKCAEIGGVYKFRAGAAGAAVLSYSDADIMVSERQGYDPFPPLDRTINHVRPRYVEPAEAWALKDAPAFADAVLESADGGRRNSAGVTYATVSSGTQVQRLARAELLDQRAFRRHAHTMPPEAQVLEPLDIVAWTSEKNGYDAKTFDVLTVNDRADVLVDVGLKELDPSAYDWEPADDEQPITVGPLALLRPAAQPIIAPDFEGVTIVGADGRERAAARVSWDPDVVDVDGMVYEIRRAADQVTVLTDQTDFWDRGELLTSANIVGNTEYEGRVKYRPASPRQTTFSGWIAFTTPDVRVTRDELTVLVQRSLDRADAVVKALSPVAAIRASAAPIIDIDLFERVINAERAMLTTLAEVQRISATLTEAGIKVDPDRGRITLRALDQFKRDVGSYQSQVSLVLDAVKAEIALRATTAYVDGQVTDIIEAVQNQTEPLYRWEFNGTAEGWTASDADLTANASTLTVDCTDADAYIERTGLTIPAADNGVVIVRIRRTAGTGWGVALQWGASFEFSQGLPEPAEPDDFSSIPISLVDDENWTGDLTQVRLALGESAADTFDIDYIEIGHNSLLAIGLGNLNARFSDVELRLDAAETEIEAKATAVDLNTERLRINQAELDIDGLESAVELRALQVDLEALDTSVSSALVEIDAARNQINLAIEQFEFPSDPDGKAALGSLLEGVFERDKRRTRQARATSGLQTRIGVTEAGLLEVIATRRDELLARIGDVSASVVQEATARATADDANASAITTVSAQVNDPTTGLTAKASVSSVSAVAARADALEALSGLQLTLDGVTGGLLITGVKPNDGGASFDAVWDVDSFIIREPGSSNKVPFAVVDGVLVANDLVINDTANIGNAVIKNANIDNLAVTTLKIANGAVTIPKSFTLGASTNCGSDNILDRSVTISVDNVVGQNVLVVAGGYARAVNLTQSINTVSTALFINGVTVSTNSFTLPANAIGQEGACTLIGFLEVPITTNPQSITVQMHVSPSQPGANTAAKAITGFYGVAYKK